MGAWRMAALAVRRNWIGPALAALLSACSSDCPDGTVPRGECVGTSSYSSGAVSAEIGAPVGFDSVEVRLYRGDVESGKLLASSTYGNGSRTVSWPEPFGDYAVKAIYRRGAQSVEAIDGGSTNTSTKADCDCYVHELKTAKLDVVLSAWP